jgi:M6 family metalloprotease-like protein
MFAGGQTQAENPSRSLYAASKLLGFMVLALCGVVATGAAAQYPRAQPGQFEVRGLDFAANGAWRRQGNQVMATRQAMLRSGGAALLNSGGRTVVRGNFFVPVIPIAYHDVAGPFPASRYQDLFFSAQPLDRPWSVKTYDAAASRGNITLDGQVFDWITVPNNAAYYQDGCNGVGVLAPCPSHPTSRMGELLLAALDSISSGPDAATVWNRFDNDGPDGIPNSGDDDGVVDVVAFLQPTIDGACSTAGLWSHRATIALWNNGQPYVTRTPRRDSQGQPIPGQFLTVDSYTIQSALGGNAACTAGEIMPVGTVTHETGHAFGLPDLYDTDPYSATQGDGEWSLMASGTYSQPYSPSSFDAWSLVQLGWVNVDSLVSGVTRTIAPIQTSNTVYYASTATNHYLLLENRGNAGSDTAQMNPAYKHAKLPGLLIWDVDADRVILGLPSNRVNTGEVQGVELVQADGFDQLRTPFGGNRGDGGDPYPGSSGNTDFGLATFPVAQTYDRIPFNVRLDHLALAADGSLTFRFVRRAPSVIAAASPLARIRVNGVALASYTEVLAPGDAVTVAADSSQLSFDGRSASRFVSWSDAGARDHTLVARSSAPDTLTATFATTHRLRIVVSGPGTVTASAVGAVGAGVFVDAGSAVHVSPAPANGSEFIGWRGDSTGTGTLDLAMAHPYDLTAVFLAPVAIDAGTAARALLGGVPLSADAAAYLDAIGNHNGSYDVGDYIAWLTRTGQRIPAAMRRVGRP